MLLDRKAADDLVLAALRGTGAAWPVDAGEACTNEFLQAVDYHGVAPMLNDGLEGLSDWPRDVRAAIHERAVRLAMWEIRHQIEMTTVLSALGTAGIEPLIYKGTALAYGLYANPVWRPRGDTDVIVPQSQAESAASVLTALGYERVHGVTGEFVALEDTFIKSAADGSRHAIDLHRAIKSAQVLSQLWTYDELRSGARSLQNLTQGAFAVGPVKAMLLACLHPATHRFSPYYVNGIAYLGGERLIWHYDIHLLAQSFTDAQWRGLLEEATQKGLCAVTREAMERAGKLFDTTIPGFVRTGLDRAGEPIAAYLRAGRSRQVWLDFLAIPDAGDRFQFLRELMFPSADYMRVKYAGARFDWLPWLYARRSFEGVVKRLSRCDGQRVAS